jgi:nucleoside 2-deoxyribosyltransferase
MMPKKVFLCGGLKTGWQDEVKDVAPDFFFFDPRNNNSNDPAEYTSWDLLGIKLADIVFAYIEEDNPGIYNMALELGYARALGKVVILIDEKSPSDPQFRHYTGMLKEAADIYFTSFATGLMLIGLLNAMARARCCGGECGSR